MRKAQVLIIVIVIVMFLSFLGIFLGYLESTYFEVSHLSYRNIQTDFINDSGMDRGKELIADSQGDWRPWAGCVQCSPVCSNCHCPTGSSCGLVCNYGSCKDCYLREYMTIPPGGRRVYYDIYVEELPGGEIKLKVESGTD